ncbi:MAG: aminotransferase class V-fold PLP-dependent enzyme [Rhodobacteraceae bacterium]|nr:aminotransferase class V-fold PLP-dependent enzyme [Paracoccaceae bacterium]
MLSEMPGLLDAVRSRFAHVDTCPFAGPRVFLENAGGSLTLRSVVETSALHAGFPDNQGRDNPASRALMEVIARGRADAALLFNAPGGQVFVGESGTEVLFRLVRTAALGAAPGGTMLGSTLEHPASRSAMARWAEVTGRPHLLAVHDNATGAVGVAEYLPHITPDLRVASIVHTSPVTGIRVDVAAVVAAIRATAPDCLVVIDGIQHASHGAIDLTAYGADGYAVSPYKMFARHGYGIGWASDRLTSCPRETVIGGPPQAWEQGTRDSGSYATFSDVVSYLDWLGGHFTDASDRRARLVAAAGAIHDQEARLGEAMLQGTDNHRGLSEMPGVTVIGGADNSGREGVVSLTLDGMDAADLVALLAESGVRTHIRKNDHYCGNVLAPLGIDACVRVSYSHYNTLAEVRQFLQAMERAVQTAARGA